MSPDRPPSGNAWDAMAHPARRFIIRELAKREVLAREIAESVQHVFGLGWPAVTRHLKILHASGFVRVRRVWNERLYRLDDEAIQKLEDDVRDLAQFWDRRVGGGYRSHFDPEDDRWPTTRAGRRPRDADEEIDMILLEFGFDPATGRPLAGYEDRSDGPGEGLEETAGV